MECSQVCRRTQEDVIRQEVRVRLVLLDGQQQWRQRHVRKVQAQAGYRDRRVHGHQRQQRRAPPDPLSALLSALRRK